MTQTAVNVFVIEPIRYWCSAVALSPEASATPIASCQTASPARKTAADTDGMRSAACAERRRRESSSRRRSGADKGSEAARDRVECGVDVRVVDVEVRDRPEDTRSDRPGKPDAGLCEPLDALDAREAEPADVELDEVRLHLLELDRRARRVKALGQTPRACVVVGEAPDVVVERVDPGCGDDPGLAHRAPEEMLEPARFCDQVRRAGEQRAERAAETLGEAERDGVEAPTDLGSSRPGRHRGVEQT